MSNGKTHSSMAIFNSYVKVPEGISSLFFQHRGLKRSDNHSHAAGPSGLSLVKSWAAACREISIPKAWLFGSFQRQRHATACNGMQRQLLVDKLGSSYSFMLLATGCWWCFLILMLSMVFSFELARYAFQLAWSFILKDNYLWGGPDSAPQACPIAAAESGPWAHRGKGWKGDVQVSS